MMTKLIGVRVVTVAAILLAAAGLIACGGQGELLVRELEVQGDGSTLHVRVAGSLRGSAVVVAVHGGPGNSSDYMHSLEQLAGEDLAVVTYDQRGTGQSTDPTNGYALSRYVADLETVRQAVGTETIHVLGHSWGGIVAMRYTTVHPQRVESLLLMGSGPARMEDARTAQLYKARRIESLQEQGIIPREISSLADLLPVYFSDPGFEMPTELKEMYYNPTVEQLTWSELGEYDFAGETAVLTLPVLILWGDDDPFGLAMGQAILEAMPAAQARLVVLDRCGHYWHECPEAFFALVRSFLNLPPEP